MLHQDFIVPLGRIQPLLTNFKQLGDVICGGDINVRLGQLQSLQGRGYEEFIRALQDQGIAHKLAELFLDMLKRQNMVICNGIPRFPDTDIYTYWSCPHRKQVLTELLRLAKGTHPPPTSNIPSFSSQLLATTQSSQPSTDNTPPIAHIPALPPAPAPPLPPASCLPLLVLLYFRFPSRHFVLTNNS